MLNISEEFKADSIIVIVEWTQAQQLDVIYYAQVSRSVHLLLTGTTSRQLIILYNVQYNFSVRPLLPVGQMLPLSLYWIIVSCGTYMLSK